MAGVTDLAFREICRRMGAGYTYTEMVSSKALVYQDKKTLPILVLGKNEHPAAVQIFGCEPETMAKAAVLALEISGADVLDINMGCPTPKIVGNGDGSALMATPKIAEAVVSAVRSAVNVPVTVKIRLGTDEGHRNAIEFAKMLENAGVDALAVHGRTRAQMYAGKADREMIAQVVDAVKIPVFANGDITDGTSALEMLKTTNAAGLMIGRAALGDPWIFSEVNAAIHGKKIPERPGFAERLDIAAEQVRIAAGQKGEKLAVLEARKHLAWYLHGIRGAAQFRKSVISVNTLDDIFTSLEHIKRSVSEGEHQ